jgi:hypothetical protein
LLRSIYFNKASPSYIDNMSTDLVDNREVHVRVKGGGEGTVVFDSAIALLQGLFPPNPNNKIVLANETTIVAPMGGYQYVPGKPEVTIAGRDANFISQSRLLCPETIVLWKAGQIALCVEHCQRNELFLTWKV